jgi:hypothetical protein
MASSPITSSPEALPSYEDHGSRRPRGNQEIFRLRWSLSSESISSAIEVLDDATDPNSPHKPFQDPETLQYHPIASLTITDPPVSSVSVEIYDLVQWPGEWQSHVDHLDDPDLEARHEEVDPRPPEHVPLVVRSASPSRPLTVLDYVGAVHPWAYRHKADMVRARMVWKTGETMPPDVEVYLSPSTAVDTIHARVPESTNPATWPAFWERIRGSVARRAKRLSTRP